MRRTLMRTEYLDRAMRHAQYERIEDGTFFGEIPGFEGLWVNAQTEEKCRAELRDVLEGWILLHGCRALVLTMA